MNFTYDSYLRLVAVTDAIGQVTTFSYENPNDFYKITRVTDPFGRFATFEFDASNRLTQNQGMNMVGSFICVNRLKIAHMSKHRILERDSASPH